jgi:hypothetical protein
MSSPAQDCAQSMLASLERPDARLPRPMSVPLVFWRASTVVTNGGSGLRHVACDAMALLLLGEQAGYVSLPGGLCLPEEIDRVAAEWWDTQVASFEDAAEIERNIDADARLWTGRRPSRSGASEPDIVHVALDRGTARADQESVAILARLLRVSKPRLFVKAV